MKKLLLLLFISFLTLPSFSQKVKIKDNIAKIDGVEYLNWEKRAMATEASVSGLTADSEEISIMYLSYEDRFQRSKSNPNGEVRWIEVNFLELNIKCEVPSRTHKGLAKMLYQSDIYVDGVLNNENAQKFVNKYGMKFSENRPGNNVNVIILNN